MVTLKFKTNINCGNCVKAVTGFINDLEGIEDWVVNTEDPEKILTVTGSGVAAQAVIEALDEAGFDAELLG